jgi:hypothetical protein
LTPLRRAEAETLTVELTPAPAEGFVLQVRSRLEPAEAGANYAGETPLGAFAAALDCLGSTRHEPLISWSRERAGRLCMVDVDLHHVPFDERPLGPAWYDLAERVAPRPAYAWSTHGRGLRLVYGAAGG